MWMDNIDSLICKRQDVVYLYFMDGDYAVRLTMMNGGANAECLSPKGTVFTEGDIDILHLGRQLISAVGKLTSFYSENKTDQRIERLNSTAKKLLHSIWKNAQ